MPLLACLLSAPAASAAEATSGADANRSLVVAMGQDFSPFQFVDAAGKPTGLVVDLWRLWSEKTGTPVAFKPAPWAETLAMVRDGRADVHAGLNLTSERQVYLDYGDPLLSTDSFLFSPVGVQVKGSLGDLVGFRVGVLKGSLEESVLSERVPGAELLAFDTVEALYDAVAANRVRLFADIEQTALYFLGERNLQPKFRFDPAAPLDSNYLFAAVGKDNAGLLERINAGLRKISAEERAAIMRRWLGRADATESETLVVAISRNYPPLSMIDSTGRPAGMLVDIWRLWAAKTGRKVEFRPSGWADTLYALKNGEADFHSGLFRSDERAEWITFSKPVYEIVSSFYHRSEDPPPGLHDDLAGRRIGVVLGYLQETFLRESYPKAEVVPLLDDAELLDALAAGKIDLILSEDPTLEVLLERKGLRGRIVGTGRTILRNGLHLGARIDATELHAVLQAGVDAITLAELSAIERRWIVNPSARIYAVDEGRVALDLTPEEREWISANPVIRAAATPDWPPFESRTADGSYVGITADFVRLVAERAGFVVEPVFDEWDAHLESLSDGTIDMAPGLYRTQDREAFMAFTRPFVDIYDVIFTQADRTDIALVGDLAGKTVAVESGYAIHELVAAEHPDVELVPVKNALEALKAVSIGGVDAYIGNQLVAGHLIQSNLLQNIKSVGFYSTKANFLTMGTPKNRPILHEILEKALASITRTERNAIIQTHAAITREAKSSANALTLAERSWLAAHPEVRVGMMRDWRPISYVDAAGRPAGVSAALIEALNQRLGGVLRIVPGDWKPLLDDVKEKRLDAVLDITPNEKRRPFYEFTSPYLTIPHVIVGRSNAAPFNSEADLAGKTVALERGFGNVRYFQENVPNVTVREYDNTALALDAVARGEADAYAGNRAVATYFIESQLMHNLVPQGRLRKDPTVLTIGVRKDWPELRDILERAIANLDADERRAIFGAAMEKPAVNAIELTDEERQWLREHPVIRVHNELDTPPFNFNEFGEPRGFSIDFMNLLAEKLGINVEYVSGPTWGEFIEAIRGKDLDVMLNIVQTDEREKFIAFTKPYRRLVTGIIVRKEVDDIRTLEDLAGKTVAVPGGFFYEEILKRDHPDIALLLTDDPLGALQAVSLGDADAAIGGHSDTNLLTQQNSIINLKMAAVINEPAFSTVLRIGVRDDWPELRVLLNKAMRMVEPQELADLEQRWFEEFSLRLDLSPQELDWIAEHPKVRAMVGTWPPFHYVENGEPKGLAVEYMREVAGRIGIEIEFVPILWADAFGGIQADDKPVDVLPTIARSAEREKVVNIARDYISFPSVIFTQKDAAIVSSLQDLAGMTVAVEENFITHRRLEKDHPDIKLLPLKTSEDALREVSLGRADAYVGNLAAGSFLIDSLGLTNLKVASPSGYPDDVQAVGVRKDWPELAAMIDKALESLTEEDHARLRQRALAVELQLGIDRTELFKWVGGVGGAAAVIIGAIVLWNRRLGGEIAERRKIEETLRAVEERTRLVLDGAGEGIFGLDTEGRTTFVNPAACDMLGYRSEELVGTPMHATVHYSRADGSPYPREDCPMFAAVQDGDVRQVTDEVLWRKDGSSFPIEYTATPMRKDGALVGAVITFKDITERKKADERFRALIESVPEAMLMVDRDGSIVRVNRQTEHLFGYDRDDLLGKPVEVLVPETIRGAHVGLRDGYFKNPGVRGMGLNRELAAVDSEGRTFPVEVSLSPIDTDEGMLVAASVRDITARKETEQALREKMDELESFNELTVDRELRMIELKKEVNDLLERDGRDPVYEIVE